MYYMFALYLNIEEAYLPLYRDYCLVYAKNVFSATYNEELEIEIILKG